MYENLNINDLSMTLDSKQFAIVFHNQPNICEFYNIDTENIFKKNNHNVFA